MPALDLPRLARVAEAAADAARREIVPRFRRVTAETKADGTPVTEADRAAERAMRAVLRDATPEFGIHGEEFGREGAAGGPAWLLDPIDGTISFSRGVPLFGTLLALVEDERPILGLIDLSALGERLVGWRGGGVRRNGEPVRVSQRADFAEALVATGDAVALAEFGERDAWLALARDVPRLRTYTDCFGHALVIGGAVDAMVDLSLHAWDAAATQVLVEEAGGRCVTLRRDERRYPLGLVFGSPPLVDRLLAYVSR